MAKILPIVKIGEEVLRQKSEPVEEVTKEVKELAENMMLTMLASQGVGLAANQVGEKLRIITVASADFVGHMINPVIREVSEQMIKYTEGCLSIPGRYLNTGIRHSEIRVEYQNINGEEHSVLFKDATSVIIQHEIDHLDGILFIDYFHEDE